MSPAAPGKTPFGRLSRHDNPWRLICDTALDAVIVMNRGGDVVEWNSHATTIFGWTRDEALDHNMSELIIPSAYRQAHTRGLARYLETGVAKVLGQRIEISGQRKSGEVFPIELSISAVDDKGDLVFVGFLRDISDRKRAEEHQQMLLEELNHRVKNMLAVVIGIASQTARHSASAAAFNDSFLARLQSLGRAHSLLTAANWKMVSLAALVADILAPAGGASAHAIETGGPSVELKPKASLALGMILHELVTNATKYGALATPAGKLSVCWEIKSAPQRAVRLLWLESGVGSIEAPQHSGFGSKMIATSVKHELRGTLAANYGADGLRWELEFPID